MNTSARLCLFYTLCLTVGLLVSVPSFGQYGGYGGGYGGYGGMRRMGGGMGSDITNTPRASIPNIAGEMGQKETKWLKENLSLTKDQAKDVKQLNNEYASQQQAAIKDIIGTKGERPSPDQVKQIREVMLMFNEEKEEKLKPILTPEQWTIYQTKKADMQKEIGGFRPPAPKSAQLQVDSTGSAKQ